jgi:DNA polymerase-1
MRASASLLRVAPLRIVGPLWAITFRAPLNEVLESNFTAWMVGETGVLKSSLAAVFLSHYGTFPDAKSLSLAWSSSANYLEDVLFTLKDSLIPLDDFVGEAEGKDQPQKAARLVRSQGNRTGRGRMTATLETRPPRPPRGLLLVTGETYPQGHSIFARTFQIEVRAGDIQTSTLTPVQRPAFLLGLRHAMAGYVQWIAPELDNGLGDRLRDELLGLRERLHSSGQHLRVTEIAAHLMIGLTQGLAFARACGALTATQVERHKAESEEAFGRLCAAQAATMAAGKPLQVFLETLQGLILERRFRLLQAHERIETAGTLPPVLGWTMRGGRDLALLPRVAIGEVLRAYRDHEGHSFALDAGRLVAELRDAKILDAEPGRTTRPERLGGGLPRVHVLRGDAMETWLGGPFQVPSAMQEPADTDRESGAARVDEPDVDASVGTSVPF